MTISLPALRLVLAAPAGAVTVTSGDTVSAADEQAVTVADDLGDAGDVGQVVTRAASEGIVGFQPRELLIIIIFFFCAMVLGVPFFRLLPPEIQQVLPARAVVAATGGPYVQKAVKDRQDRMQKQLALLARALSNCSTVAVCDPASLAWPIYHAAGRMSTDSRLARESSALDAQGAELRSHDGTSSFRAGPAAK